MKKPIVFIHGLYMNPVSWEHWVTYFEAQGYPTLAPGWPGRDKVAVADLNKQYPDLQQAKLTLSDVIDNYVRIIKGLDQKPILIGHSMGGLITQLLLQKGIATAGVAIDAAPPLGLLSTQWSFWKGNWPHLNPFASKDQQVKLSFEEFQYAFVNDMPLDEQRYAYDHYAVPDSRRVAAQALTLLTKVDFNRPHVPLLLIAGENDHIIPASLNKANYEKYKDSSSVTDFKEFAGRNHYIVGQKNWEEVAGYALNWIEKNAK